MFEKGKNQIKLNTPLFPLSSPNYQEDESMILTLTFSLNLCVLYITL